MWRDVVASSQPSIEIAQNARGVVKFLRLRFTKAFTNLSPRSCRGAWPWAPWIILRFTLTGAAVLGIAWLVTL